MTPQQINHLRALVQGEIELALMLSEDDDVAIDHQDRANDQSWEEFKRGFGSGPSYEDLVWALVNVLNGVKEHELRDMTGMGQFECKRLWSIYERALNDQHS